MILASILSAKVLSARAISLLDPAVVDVAHELHVELQVARVEVRDLLQARVAGADVVDRDREAHLGEVLRAPRRTGVVLDRLLLAHLEHDPLRREPEALEQLDERGALAKSGSYIEAGNTLRKSRNGAGRSRAVLSALRRQWRSSSNDKVGRLRRLEQVDRAVLLRVARTARERLEAVRARRAGCPRSAGTRW